MERKQKIIVFCALIILVMVMGSMFYFLYFKNYISIKDTAKEIQIKKTTNSSCLEENEFADYVIDEKYAKEIKVPTLPLTIFIQDKTTNEKSSFQIDNTGNPRGPRPQLHKCGVYVTREFNFDPKTRRSTPNYSIELWKYDYSNQGGKILLFSKTDSTGKYQSYFNDDFHISPDEKYLVLEKGYLGKDDYSLVIKDLKTKQDVFALPAKEIVKQYPNLVGNFNMRDWTKDSRYFWGDIFDGADALAIFRIDSTVWKWKVFEVPPYTMGGTALNPEYGYITYDDGPPWTGDVDFDEINKEKWLKEGKKLNFYLYNLFTKEKILLATVEDPLWNFKPQWLSDAELQYELPNGEKKIYTIK
ncbi:hypothetical protein HZB05_02620 [Candidatus Wolfebacteria bacterium]|nr:hypothetical protein [Candidatus Wolfebacteria bacterium]